MKTEFFNYNLPKELIAQAPEEKRDQSRLMILEKDTGEISHRKFYEIINFLNPEDIIVINNTKVLQARIFGICKKMREILLIKETEHLKWEAYIKPQRGIEIGDEIVFNNSLKAKIETRNENGTFILSFSSTIPLDDIGFVPLPPYIKRDYTKPELHEEDKIRYQTVYAKNSGAIAAPTAGLHFTENLLKKIKDKGITIAPITLHVGIGTFKPVRSENIEEHTMHSEWFSIPEETTELIKKTKKNGRVIAVGTTTARAIETSIQGSGYTNIFIYPPYKFKAVDALITNFHLPKSTLLMLISAFAGRDLIMKAYEEAVKNKYRFFSYGDAMLII
jgi:S-adenosylmethionine:tRNA ribosyltransferase-isomerase